MTALIAGVDFSSRALHAALVPLDADHGSDCPPVTLRRYVLPTYRELRGSHDKSTPQKRSVERCRLVRDAMRALLAPLYVIEYPDHEVAHVCVEEPFGAGRKADNVMRELYGAILASIPPHIQRDTIGTQEWRRLTWDDTERTVIGSWKDRAIWRAFFEVGIEMDEHEAESYLIATAARHRLDAATRSIA